MLNLTKEYPTNNDAQILSDLAYLNKGQTETIHLNTMESPALLTAQKFYKRLLFMNQNILVVYII